MKHDLVITDRGAGHIHRWATSCRCGWIGPHRKRRRDCGREYRAHLASETRHTIRRRGRRITAPGWRPTTPTEQLPAVLQ